MPFSEHLLDLLTLQIVLGAAKVTRNNRELFPVSVFLNIGLVMSLLFVITAFEWRFYVEGSLVDLGRMNDDFEEMLDIPLTEQPPPPPPKIQQPKITEVPDEEEIEDEIDVDLDIEITEDETIEEIIIEEPVEEVVDQIFNVVEKQPEFPGGQKAFLLYIQKNLLYPEQAKRMGIEGKVFVQFVVDKEGKLSEVKAIKGIGAGCEDEAVRVIRSSPKWNPGKQRGRAVKVRIVVPLTFSID